MLLVIADYGEWESKAEEMEEVERTGEQELEKESDGEKANSLKGIGNVSKWT